MVVQHRQYIHHNETPVLDKEGNITQDTLRVKSSITDTPLLTVNLHRTSSKVICNGPKYKIFEDKELPVLKKIRKVKPEKY